MAGLSSPRTNRRATNRRATTRCGASRAWVTFSRRETLRALYVAGRKQEVSQKGASASPFLNEPSHSKDRVFAKRLIAYETRGNRSFETNTPVAFLVGEKLRPHLARLMGKVGFRELLSRALVLAKAEVPWLNAVRIKADGSFEELDELAAQVDPDEIFEGRVILLAQLLGRKHPLWAAGCSVALGARIIGAKGWRVR